MVSRASKQARPTAVNGTFHARKVANRRGNKGPAGVWSQHSGRTMPAVSSGFSVEKSEKLLDDGAKIIHYYRQAWKQIVSDGYS
jgi:hypothetical protein